MGLEKLRRLAVANASIWYEHIISNLGLEMDNGALCLVTGCEKAAYWALGAYISSRPGSQFVRRMAFHPPNSDLFDTPDIIEQPGQDGPLEFLMTRELPFHKGNVSEAKQRHCIALRGFHMSIHSRLFNTFRTPRTTLQRFWRAIPPALRPDWGSWPVVADFKPVCASPP